MAVLDEEYFHRLARESPTEFWINNPTLAEATAALEAGARCATTNPTYLSRLLKEEPEYVAALIDAAAQTADDDDAIADVVLQRALARLQQLFEPLHQRTHGRYGYVAIQGDPRMNTNAAAILEGAIRYRKLGENIMIKVPAWPAGAVALEQLVELGIPSIATLGFSVDQAVYMAEVYRRAVKRTRTRPPCYVTFIAGVLDTYLAGISAEKGDRLSHEALRQAGCEASRAAYKIYRSRGYEAVLLGGGARGAHHFTELVGAEMAITIGWNLAQEIIAANEPVVPRIDAPAPAATIESLELHLADFRKAYGEKMMQPEEFCNFGPVAAFQGTFLAAVDMVLRAIAARQSSAMPGRVGR